MRAKRSRRALLRAGVSVVLCSVLTLAESFAAPSAKQPGGSPARATKRARVADLPPLTKDQRALHALSRFTFGPRPGDVATLKRIGFNRWFEQQLHPDTIDDKALQAQLEQFPAMSLSSAELMQRFPSPGDLRRDVRQQVELPSDPAERAIYASAEYRFQQRAQQQAEAKTSPMPAGDAQVRTGGGLRNVEQFQGDPQTILNKPPAERMAAIYAMAPEQFALLFRRFNAEQKGDLLIGLTPVQKETLGALETAPVRLVETETLEARLLRDIESRRQLQAVMTDFWLNHFNVYLHKNQDEPYLLNSYERDTIQPNALGKFEDLLDAVAQSPAMQIYLDNAQSLGPDSLSAGRGRKGADAPNKKAQAAPKGINENYARELLELHTLGVQCEVSADKPIGTLDRTCGTGYTQADVQAVAAVLTGWGVAKPRATAVPEVAPGNVRGNQGVFYFNPDRHEPGDKQVQGVIIRGRQGEDGMEEGREVLHLLAMSPATAHFLCHKLAVRFLSDTPPASVENRMSATYLSSGGDIAAVLRTLFNSTEFWSPKAYRAKVKTPLEFVVSAMRATDTTVTSPIDLVTALDKLGMPLYGMQTPNGYSWNNADWVSANALINRMNFAMVLSGGLLPGTDLDWSRLVGSQASEAQFPSLATEHALETKLLGQAASDRTRTVLMEQADRPGQALAAQKTFTAAPGSASMRAGSKTAWAITGEDPQSLALTKASFKKKPAEVRPDNQFSMSALASQTAQDTPVSVMGGLLLGSPEFQRR